MSADFSTPVNANDAYLKSAFYEKLVEHVFVSEVLQEAWYHFGKTAEVLRSEVDASGYDVVIECNNVLRHIQLKTSKRNAKAAVQKVNVALADKPGGCVVWLIRDDDAGRIRLTYRFFGERAGEQLSKLKKFKRAKHTKANALGIKTERPAIRVIPKAEFESIASTTELVMRLFDLRKPTASVPLDCSDEKPT